MNAHHAFPSSKADRTEDYDAEPVGRQVLATALDLIMKFADMLIKDPIDIEVRDERELPASKETLIQCFALILMAETREEWRKAYYETGVQLAYFWPGLGRSRLKLPDHVFGNALDIGKSRDELQATLLPDADEIRAFSQAFSKVKDEHDRIAALFNRAIESLLAVIDHE